jgi:hypothetical protein
VSIGDGTQLDNKTPVLNWLNWSLAFSFFMVECGHYPIRFALVGGDTMLNWNCPVPIENSLALSLAMALKDNAAWELTDDNKSLVFETIKKQGILIVSELKPSQWDSDIESYVMELVDSAIGFTWSW